MMQPTSEGSSATAVTATTATATATESASALTPFFGAEGEGDEEDPEVASESAAGADDMDVIFQVDRMEAALSHVQNSKERVPLRPSKFSLHRMEQQANNSHAGDPFWTAFGERVPAPSDESSADPQSGVPRPVPKTAFAASKLGIPSLPIAHEELRKARSAAASAVHYLHIPEHSMKDFQSFAQSAANEAIVENNPYIRALNSHRAKLQQPLFDTPRTLEQLMATDPASLAQLDELSERSVRFTMEEEVCGPPPGDTSFFPVAFASCLAFGASRCTQRARCEDFGREDRKREPPNRRCAVQQLAALSSSVSASFLPEGQHQPQQQQQQQQQQQGQVEAEASSSSSVLPRLQSSVGSPSCSSTAASSPQVCDEADAGTGAIRQTSHSRGYLSSAAGATGGSSSSTARRLLLAETGRNGSQEMEEDMATDVEIDSETAAVMAALAAAEAADSNEDAPQSSTKVKSGGPTLLSRQRFFGGVFTKVKV